MYICICNAVTDSEIIKAHREGKSTFKQISQHLGVGKCCGRCVNNAKQVIADSQKQMQASAVSYFNPLNQVAAATPA